MKILLLQLCIFLLASKADAQIFKKIGDKVKRDSEWRIRSKADQQVNKGLDSLIAIPKKTSDKKKAEKTESKTATPETPDNKNTAVKNTITANKQDENDMTPKDGFLTLTLSTEEVFTGGSVLISGESVKYKNFNQVEIKVKGPSGPEIIKNIPLAANGKFNVEWISSNVTGDFTVTVTTGDKKAVQTAKFTVSEMELIFDEEWPEKNIKATKQAYDKLNDAVDNAEASLGSKDKADLDKKLALVKEKVDISLKLFQDLNSAAKEITRLCKTGKKLSPNLAGNLSALNNNLTEHARQMNSIAKLADHQPQDNTVCEYLVMVGEACAAFSAFTNFWSTSIKTILLNITLDKGVPKVAETINSKTVDLSSPNDFLMKEPAKIFATAVADAGSLTTKLGTAGFAGDITQFASDFLLKKYCGVFKGEIKHDYLIDFRNKIGTIWWRYGVVVRGAIMLRYPKEGSKGKIIKMKGNIEGNATKFMFYQNVESDDGFYDGSHGKIEVVELKVIKPAAFPFVSSMNDAAGFGAIARTLATPACFNITMDAEYDVDANKIKIFLNRALIDFTDLVNNQLIFLEVGADLFPYIKNMTFPIAKVFTTLGSVVRSNNEFTVEKDNKGNLSFSGKANKHIGNKTDKIEHDLNFFITAKKE